MVAEVASVSWAGALAGRRGLRLAGVGAVRLAQAVKLVYGCQEQAADLGQICSWAVTQPSLQLAPVFAASF